MNDAGDDVPTPDSPKALDAWLGALSAHLAANARKTEAAPATPTLSTPVRVVGADWVTLDKTPEIGESLGLRLHAGKGGERSSTWVPPSGIRLVALRRIESLCFEWLPRSDDSGRWMVLLGENGTGKTTILRALALAYADDSIASACLAALPGSLVRHGFKRAGILVGPTGGANGRPRARVIKSASRVDQLGPAFTDDGGIGHIFAYGCQRGSALGGASRAVDLRPLAQVATLFNEGAALISAERWLADERNLMNESAEGKARSGPVIETVCAVLVDMLPGIHAVDVTATGVSVAGPAVGRVELSALSDGYLSTVGWIVDLMARWIDIQREEGRRVEGGFNQRMTGLVLVDEIDEHLHPRWQIELLPMIRRQFPRLDFVVTTHNPMTLRGTGPGEVYVLEDEDGRITARQADLEPGVRADQVLTGPWFQLSSALVDKETLRLYREHAQMLRDGVSPDDDNRLALEDELRGRLDFFAETTEERVALDVAAQYMNGYPELNYEERRAVRRRIEALFQRKMKHQDP